MRKVLPLFIFILGVTLGWLIKSYFPSLQKESIQKIKEELIEDKPLIKYTIENLSQTDIKGGNFKIIDELSETDDFTAYLFEFEFDPNIDGKTTKKITGQINIPKKGDFLPIIVMLRGYINQETYKTGDGTRNAASFFAKNGFITVAPDFLGYGGSDKEADNIFESRFQTYVTVLSLLKSLKTIEQFNNRTISLWGHSNGGQIALTVLEITGADNPTSLWAPVSKPFPYSVLYYTDASVDRGKLIRKELAKFEQDYDPDLYTLDLYLDKINAPLQIQQGTEDDAVPVKWSDELVAKLKDLNKEVTYYKYAGGDHNMRPIESAWNKAVARDLEFFIASSD